jgi:hypothetical protein
MQLLLLAYALSLHELQITLQQVIKSEGENYGHYIGSLYNQIGNVYFRQDDFDTAKINYNLALQCCCYRRQYYEESSSCEQQ